MTPQVDIRIGGRCNFYIDPMKAPNTTVRMFLIKSLDH